MVKCPFCHSANVEAEHDYNEIKNEIKKYAKEISEVLPGANELINTALLYNPYDDDEYLKRLEEKGLSYFCLDCGNVFYEKDSDLGLNPVEITKEEFETIILDELSNTNFFGGVMLDNDTKENLIKSLIGNRKKYYKEMAYRLIEDFKDRSSELDEYILDKKIEELPS